MAERQYGKYIADIRSDHVERYDYASTIVSGHVLDAACGCGYGSYIICLRRQNVNVLGVDISGEALDFARSTWKHERNRFAKWDLEKVVPAQSFDWLLSFETIEHLENPAPFLRAASKVCKNIICSVPNQNVILFSKDKFPFHYRHYTPEEITDLLHKTGWNVTKIQYQKSAYAEGFNVKSGRSIILEGVSNTKI
jgi:2-polyprenyl-3-methyl-5-hydroxy-6-metoxy-1,4-benzoquinol methylase